MADPPSSGGDGAGSTTAPKERRLIHGFQRYASRAPARGAARGPARGNTIASLDRPAFRNAAPYRRDLHQAVHSDTPRKRHIQVVHLPLPPTQGLRSHEDVFNCWSGLCPLHPQPRLQNYPLKLYPFKGRSPHLDSPRFVHLANRGSFHVWEKPYKLKAKRWTDPAMVRLVQSTREFVAVTAPYFQEALTNLSGNGDVSLDTRLGVLLLSTRASANGHREEPVEGTSVHDGWMNAGQFSLYALPSLLKSSFLPGLQGARAQVVAERFREYCKRNGIAVSEESVPPSMTLTLKEIEVPGDRAKPRENVRVLLRELSPAEAKAKRRFFEVDKMWMNDKEEALLCDVTTLNGLQYDAESTEQVNSQYIDDMNFREVVNQERKERKIKAREKYEEYKLYKLQRFIDANKGCDIDLFTEEAQDDEDGAAVSTDPVPVEAHEKIETSFDEDQPTAGADDRNAKATPQKHAAKSPHVDEHQRKLLEDFTKLKDEANAPFPDGYKHLKELCKGAVYRTPSPPPCQRTQIRRLLPLTTELEGKQDLCKLVTSHCAKLQYQNNVWRDEIQFKGETVYSRTQLAGESTMERTNCRYKESTLLRTDDLCLEISDVEQRILNVLEEDEEDVEKKGSLVCQEVSFSSSAIDGLLQSILALNRQIREHSIKASQSNRGEVNSDELENLKAALRTQRSELVTTALAKISEFNIIVRHLMDPNTDVVAVDSVPELVKLGLEYRDKFEKACTTRRKMVAYYKNHDRKLWAHCPQEKQPEATPSPS